MTVVKTVLIACDTFAPDRNGTATFSKNLACGLQSRGYEIHVVAPAISRLYGTFREQHDGVEIIVHRLKSRRIPFHPTQRYVNPIGLGRKVVGLVAAVSPDLVHVQSHINIGHHAALAALKSDIRLIATSHIDSESLIENSVVAPKFIKRFLSAKLLQGASRILKSADVLVTPTPRAAALLERVVSKKKVLTISGGVNLENYESVSAPRQSAKTVLYVGRLDREKHVYVLLEALARVPKDINLEIVGSGAQEAELIALSHELGLADRCSFYTDLTDIEVVERLSDATVFVMPSTQELQSMATLEALAAGRPIVAAKAMALPNLVKDGENGFLYKPDSPNDLAAKLTAIFGLPKKEFDAFAEESKKISLQNDLARTIDNYELVYANRAEEVLDGSREAKLESKDTLTNLFGALVRKGVSGIERGSSGVLARLDGVRGSVSETFGDVRFSIERRSRRAAKKLSSSLRKALERIRRDD